MFAYPAKFEVAPQGGYTVSFRDLPGVVAHGGDLDSANVHAAEEVAKVVIRAVKGGGFPPSPTAPRPREQWVSMPAVAVLSILATWAPDTIQHAARLWLEHFPISEREGLGRLEQLQRAIKRHVDLRDTIVTKIDAAVASAGTPAAPPPVTQQVLSVLDAVTDRIERLNSITQTLEPLTQPGGLDELPPADPRARRPH